MIWQFFRCVRIGTGHPEDAYRPAITEYGVNCESWNIPGYAHFYVCAKFPENFGRTQMDRDNRILPLSLVLKEKEVKGWLKTKCVLGEDHKAMLKLDFFPIDWMTEETTWQGFLDHMAKHYAARQKAHKRECWTIRDINEMTVGAYQMDMERLKLGKIDINGYA